MKKFLFADLDDSLFQTPHKCRGAEQLQPIAYYQDGSACSFTTPSQREFLALAAREMTLIPTTARDADALTRVDMQFDSYAILDFGGVILQPGGALDQTWLRNMQQQLALSATALQDLLQEIETYLARQSWQGRTRLVDDFDTTFYALIKENDKHAPHLAQVEQELLLPWIAAQAQQQQHFYLHRNANNLAILPRCLNKLHAVHYVQQQLRAEFGNILSFGIGDSHSDAQFLRACDYAIIPTGSQLAGRALEAA